MRDWNEIVAGWWNESSTQGILTTDAGLKIRGWNRWLESRSGRPAADMIGQNLLEVYPELAARGLERRYQEALAGRVQVLAQSLHRYLLPMPADDDHDCEMMLQSACIAPLLERERVIGTVTVIEDVTERVWTENRLGRLNAVLHAMRNVGQLIARERDQERLLRGACHLLIETRGYKSAWIVLGNAAQGLALAAQAGLGERASLVAERLESGALPQRAQEALARAEALIVAGDCPASGRKSDRGKGDQGMVARLEHGGQVYGLLAVSVHKGSPPDAEERELFQGIAADIAFALHSIEQERALQAYSERLEAEVRKRTQELREAQEQLVLREKLAIVGQLARGVSHELRHPLAVIAHAVYYLRETLAEVDENQREFLDIVSDEVRNAVNIVTELDDFASARPAAREKIALLTLTAQVLEKHPAPPGVQVHTSLSADLPMALISPIQIELVLAHLLKNAYQAMPKGGNVMLKARARNGQIAFSVTDEGCGIAPENMARIFEPLFSTRMRGIGLGLAICQSLVQANGGRIAATSREGTGSTFTVFLPVEEETR